MFRNAKEGEENVLSLLWIYKNTICKDIPTDALYSTASPENYLIGLNMLQETSFLQLLGQEKH
ncbi:hypothetical protein [Thermoanaerobacterium thermosaccharolyticum]|uniref:Uncharacterized protein n=1 Tax=Thermoanaerobacterium thermosaccharolyticum M0795 TaxID=698948 RepID=L0IH82_THETR|nr:hypothetical protein [Thermoanaerobacterium thermosaccharolyticum]AGB18865.1 hypothetical protein Thethe_01219 [Thermoanaerobacterium thermosaccharolyticum M0795]